ncbi:exopolysaccharide biosynthesis protein [Gloeomargaritales cyanobacterium VI4D9]|nr:exopolysaccharide biosynthesis protein [Gloeomargaritales cyanobacterium VI4D9]
MPRLSVKLQDWLAQPEPPEAVTLRDILQFTGESSWGMMLVLFSFPSALPLPAPGYSTPFGLFIMLVAGQWLTGATIPWLPERFLRSRLSWEQFRQLVQAGIPWLQRLERLTRPRWLGVTKRGHWLLGGLVGLMGLSMTIPIPGTNTIPAMGVFLIGFGLIETDGVICLGGALVALIGGTLTISILTALWLGGTNILEWLKIQVKTLLGGGIPR